MNSPTPAALTTPSRVFQLLEVLDRHSARFQIRRVFAIVNLPARNRKVAGHHFFDPLREACLRLPTELFARLAGVADQEIDFGGAEIYGIDANDRLAGFPVDAGFLDPLA